jgi:thiamine transporter
MVESGFVEEGLSQNKGTKIRHFFHRWSWLIGIGLLGISLCFLCGPLLQYRVKDDDGNKFYFFVYFWDFLSGKYPLDWNAVAVPCLLIIAVVFSFFHKKSSNFLMGAMVFSLLAAILQFLGRDFFVNSNPDIDSSHVVLYWGLGVASAISVCASLMFFLGSYDEENVTVHEITETGMLVAMAVALDYVIIWKFSASGGSLTIAMLPLYIIALRYGPVKGFLAGGVVFGLITCLKDAYGFFTYPFDYLFAFGSVGLLGFLRKWIFTDGQHTHFLKGEILLLLGIAVCTTIRCLSSTISGVLYYASELEGSNKFLASFVLAAPYCYSSGALVAAILMLGYGPLLRINSTFPVKPSKNLSGK